ncbi:MAG: hypothetical protein GY767_04170, partial [Shimia sp.]|nr:hypothetical protein [Shimia sp.]
ELVQAQRRYDEIDFRLNCAASVEPCLADEALVSQILLNLVLNAVQAHWIAEWVSQHGCFFAQWGVCPKVIRILIAWRVLSLT